MRIWYSYPGSYSNFAMAPSGSHSVDDGVGLGADKLGAGRDGDILIQNDTVTPGAKLVGTKSNPIIIKRGETV